MELFLFIACAALIAALFTVRWPVHGALGLYAFLLPFDAVLLAGQVGSINLHLTWFAGAAACAVLLLAGLTNRGFLHPPRTALLWFLFVMWTLLSAGWAINPQDAIFRFPVIGLLLLIYLVAACMYVTEEELSAVVWMAVLGGFAAASITLYQFHQGTYWSPEILEQLDPIDGLEASRRASLVLFGKVTNPNVLAASLILPLSLAVGLWLSTRSWLNRLILTGVIGLTGSCVLLTMSRGSWIAIVIVAFIFLWRTRADWRLVVPFLIMSGILLAMPEVFFMRFEDAVADRGSGRLDIWNAGLHVFGQHSLWGVGLDSFPIASEKYRYLAVHYWGAGPKSPHNIYLGIAVELGAIGLVLLLNVFSAHFLASSRAFRSGVTGPGKLRLVSYEAACWGLLVAGFFTHLVWEQYFWFAWALLIMGVRLNTTTLPRRSLPERSAPALVRSRLSPLRSFGN
jgi:O-antigen ligase